MKKYRVNTTISQKHHDILKEFSEKYGTQQKTLEHALESLKNNLNHVFELSSDEKLWIRIYREILDINTILPKDLTKKFLENMDVDDFRDYVKNAKPADFAVEWYHNKPLKECTLHEIIEAVILNIKMQSSADTVNFTEKDNCFTITLTHNLGINNSKCLVIMNESVFKSFGANFESDFSERGVFFKVYK